MPAAPPYWEAPTEALLAGCQSEGPRRLGGAREGRGAATGSQGAAAQEKARTQKQAEDQEVEGWPAGTWAPIVRSF